MVKFIPNKKNNGKNLKMWCEHNNKAIRLELKDPLIQRYYHWIFMYHLGFIFYSNYVFSWDNGIKLGAIDWFQIFYRNDIHIIWAE